MSLRLAILALAGAAGLLTVQQLMQGFGSADDACPAQFASGTPPAVAKPRDRTARTLCFSGYAVRFSEATKTPIWAAERLTGDGVRRAGDLPRTGQFHEEPRLPAGSRSQIADYRRTGYDRGHMAPSGDMPSPGAQNESFSLANMIPQHPCSNQGIWAGIESAVRTMAMRQDELYVVTGPIYSRPGAERALGGRGPLVPDQIFKAVYDPVTGQAAAYVAENGEEASLRVLPIATLRDLTGVDAFPSLPEDAKKEALKLPPPEKSRYRCHLHSSGETPQ